MLHYQFSMAFLTGMMLFLFFLLSYCSLLLHAILIIPFFFRLQILSHCDDGAK